MKTAGEVLGDHGPVEEGVKDSPWRPIESAPVDGTPFVGFDASWRYLAVGYFNAHSEFEQMDRSGQPMGIGFFPTHWTALPARPQPTKEGEGK